MATREENLKKINDQLEMLSDDELDNVSGGYLSETIDIVSAIGPVASGHGTNEKGYLRLSSVARYLRNRYGIEATLGGTIEESDGLRAMIEGTANQYSRNGQTLTHRQVMDIINHRSPVHPENRGRLTRCE
ncbi:MAG: hypothetical protein IJ685_06555 [Selenomonadaceae bacterium]|nr:hypothetical protein [Selenomonadaceae bacterium]